MKKTRRQFNFIKTMRVAHLLIIIIIIAALLYLTHELYENFYLPYTLSDPPTLPNTTITENPDIKMLNDTAAKLKQRQNQNSITEPIKDIFWGATSTSATTST